MTFRYLYEKGNLEQTNILINLVLVLKNLKIYLTCTSYYAIWQLYWFTGVKQWL